MEANWIKVCSVDDIEMDDVFEFKIREKTIGIFHIEKGYYAMDGLCTHEQASLLTGYINGEVVECPKHNARFNIISGKALRRPACVDLLTYNVKVEKEFIYIKL